MLRRLAATLALTATAMVAMPTAHAAAPTDRIVGDVVSASYVWKQHDGDCEEGAAAAIIAAFTGHAVDEGQIEAKAVMAGILPPSRQGSNWGRAPELFTTVGLHAAIQSLTLAQAELALSSGARLEAAVNAETLWAAAVTAGQFPPAPAGYTWPAFHPGSDADHAVVLDQIDVTAQTATVSDSATGTTYTIPLTAWSTAVATSAGSYTVVTH